MQYDQSEYPSSTSASDNLVQPEENSAGTIEEAISTLAQQIAEQPTRLRKRQDVTQILERMTDGVIVSLHISRPRFTVSIAPKRGGTAFGLEKLGITNSSAAQQVVKEYFSLGRHSLLPTDLQKELANIENSARACLDRFSFKTHWGYFVPTSNYPEWKKQNEDFQQQFEQKKQYVLNHYDEIVDQVLSAYRTLAEDAWMQVQFGSRVVRENNLSGTAFEQLQLALATGEGKEEFIQSYIQYIQSEMPTREEITESFEYELELGYIPLPSLLARDMDEADHVMRSRTLRDARLRAEMDVIEAQRRSELDAIQEQQRLEEARQRAEWQKLNEQQRIERQAAYLKIQGEEEKLRAEREKIDLQRAMDRDVIGNARKQKDQLVQEFYTGVIAQMNRLVSEVCEETLHSLDEHHDILRGPVSVRLGNLVKRLKNLNFVEDEQIDEQIKRLESVLPTPSQRDEARRGVARIETSGIRKAVEQIHKEAEETLLELGLSPIRRKGRHADELQGDALMVNQPRKSRRSLELSDSGTTETHKRRIRGAMKL
jgi:hypothetical protein